ncbi:MAG: hypothetical protein MUO62_01905 [Anaerolineales bacterium]|nr:hypothetical protein [Anaerolineales bacterium]
MHLAKDGFKHKATPGKPGLVIDFARGDLPLDAGCMLLALDFYGEQLA